jgi:hypothetical protein
MTGAAALLALLCCSTRTPNTQVNPRVPSEWHACSHYPRIAAHVGLNRLLGLLVATIRGDVIAVHREGWLSP